MFSEKRTASVRLGPEAERRLEKAASLMKQSRGAFLEKADDERARRILLDWSVKRYRQGNTSFSAFLRLGREAVRRVSRASAARHD